MFMKTNSPGSLMLFKEGFKSSLADYKSKRSLRLFYNYSAVTIMTVTVATSPQSLPPKKLRHDRDHHNHLLHHQLRHHKALSEINEGITSFLVSPRKSEKCYLKFPRTLSPGELKPARKSYSSIAS